MPNVGSSLHQGMVRYERGGQMEDRAMRIAAILVAATLTASAAEAGSMQALPALDAPAPSMVMLGNGASHAMRPSLVTLSEPAVSEEQVASVASQRASHRRPVEQPMLIRGGELAGGR